MRIEAIDFKSFPPFVDSMVRFPAANSGSGTGDVHLLTGQNGTGKTRLLCLLAAACGNDRALGSRFPAFRSSGTCVDGLIDGSLYQWRCLDGTKIAAPSPSGYRIGSFADISKADVFAFQGIASAIDAKILALAPLKAGEPKDHLTFDPSSDDDAVVICQSMANLKVRTALDVMRGLPASESRGSRVMQQIESVVSQITGRQFSFDLSTDVRLGVIWGDVTMSLGQLPDGLRSIIGWLVSCVAKLDARHPESDDPLSFPLVLLLDEPESHLHPAWQRKIFPALQALFPQAQIFAATHSPSVISSVNDGWIHVFRSDTAGQVAIDPPRPCSKGDTYIDVVEDILGVTEWYDPETEGLLAKFRQSRDSVLEGSGDYASLASQAEALASRSESLRNIMGREMRQLEKQLAQRKTSA